jgi:pyruvate/2-oxoglutarate dehydrogenase complex dihydrolipoamide acyltransferase (E2) component
MQSNAVRALVAIGSVAAIVVLFVVLSDGDDDDSGSEQAAATTTATTSEPAGATTDSEPAEKEEKREPAVDRIVVKGGEPKGGVQELTYVKGDRVRIEVSSDVDEHVHVHGYDLFEDVSAGGKAKFSFRADIDGVFEIELEDSGVQLAQLAVKP